MNQIVRNYIAWMLERYKPYCGHPGCKYEAFPAAVVQDKSGHVSFTCKDMGHWVGYEFEVRWEEKT